MRTKIPAILILLFSLALMGCGEKERTNTGTPTFTKVDSLTDRYLFIRDNMLLSWNVMITDDNRKLRAMHGLLHELMVTHSNETETLVSFEQRLDQLERIRYSAKSMMNSDVIIEYDRASDALINELIKYTEAQKEFEYNSTLQKLVSEIRKNEFQKAVYRSEYDSLAMVYNQFIEHNQEYLHEIDPSIKIEKKPLFQVLENN